MKSEFYIDHKGNIFWSKNERLHREDGPAVEFVNGDKHWYLNGKCHREDGPAAEYANGNRFWYIHGKRHREDGPAVEYTNGDKHWFYYDELLSVYSNEEFIRMIKLKSFW